MPTLKGTQEILDTTAGDTGSTYELASTTAEVITTATVQCEIGSGDTVVFEGKVHADASFVTISTFTANTLVEVTLPPIFRARRTVDGGSADSNVWVSTT